LFEDDDDSMVIERTGRVMSSFPESREGSQLQQRFFPKSKPILQAQQIGAERKRKRTQLLNSLKAGGVKFADILKMTADKANPEAQLIAGRTRVKQLLSHMPHVARAKVAGILVLARVDPAMTVTSLCAPSNRHVLEELIKAMMDRAPSLRIPGVLGLRLEPVK